MLNVQKVLATALSQHRESTERTVMLFKKESHQLWLIRKVLRRDRKHLQDFLFVDCSGLPVHIYAQHQTRFRSYIGASWFLLLFLRRGGATLGGGIASLSLLS